MSDSEKYRSVLRQTWGYDDFRGIQLPIIESIGSGRDTLGLMPTGGGKSITFQVPALCMPGTCLVITPLIALMKDQVRELREKGLRAVALHSEMSHDQCVAALENCILGGYKFLYVSPERLSSPFFLSKLKHLNISFITIDEAHCISQWGYDFRPSYLQIAQFRAERPGTPVLALTATATPPVVDDIQQQLGFPAPNVFRMSFRRPNLAYVVRQTGGRQDVLMEELRQTPGSTIIYQRNRQRCEQLAEALVKCGESATYFHAGLRSWEKDERQADWLAGKTRIMVATNAFGMGINKPDVRLVLHTDLPDSLEEYFQEAGRAGRDGRPARSVILLSGSEKTAMKRRISRAFPDIDYIQRVYECLGFYFQIGVGDGMNVTRELHLEDFCRTYQLQIQLTQSALTLLDRTRYIEYEETGVASSRLHVIATRSALLRNVQPDEERMFVSIFRHYGGIFSDYTFIDEQLVSQDTGLTVEYIYRSLSDLNRRHIVRYIPRKSTPRVTFPQRRVDRDDVLLPASVYADRKREMTLRIQAMYDYCATPYRCRSQQLLHYFGESDSPACGICDVCQGAAPRDTGDSNLDTIRHHIINLLLSGPLRPEEIRPEGFPEATFWQVFQDMNDKGEVRIEDFHFVLSLPADNTHNHPL